MSFNRLKYDQSVQKEDQINSIKQGLYQLNPPVIKKNHYQMNPQIINQKTGVSMNRNHDWRFYAGPIDVDSDVKNITRPLSKCSKSQYIPRCGVCGASCQNQINENNGIMECKMCKTKSTCDNNLQHMEPTYFPTQNTRLDNPACNLRTKTHNRFMPELYNPNANLWMDNINMVTQQVIKQNYKPEICIPKMNNM